MKLHLKLDCLICFASVANIAAAQLVATDRCTALPLYGNAVNSRLCTGLSPAGQSLQVCELSAANPDIHLTFSQANPAGVPLHLTVRSINGCDENVEIGRNNGVYAAVMRNAQGGIIPNPNPVACNVNVTAYTRLPPELETVTLAGAECYVATGASRAATVVASLRAQA